MPYHTHSGETRGRARLADIGFREDGDALVIGEGDDMTVVSNSVTIRSRTEESFDHLSDPRNELERKRAIGPGDTLEARA